MYNESIFFDITAHMFINIHFSEVLLVIFELMSMDNKMALEACSNISSDISSPRHCCHGN